MSKSFAFALSFLVAASSADACMTFVVGKKASATGRSVISARTAVRCRPSRMRRFFVWSLDKRRDPYAKRCAVVTPCGSRHPDCENVVRSRWLELTMADSDRIEVDGVALEGPDVAATPADLARQAYRLEKRACPHVRAITSPC